NLSGRTYIERIAALETEIVGPRHFHAHGARSRPIGTDGQRNPVALFRSKLESQRLVVVTLDGAVGHNRETVVAGSALDVVELELDGTFVAGPQETRQSRGQHDRIAHGHVAGGLADLILAPRDGHHAN